MSRITNAILKLFGCFALLKLSGFYFHWVYFPKVISENGVWRGAVWLFSIQWVAYVVLWLAYDALGRDLSGIVALKAGWNEFMEKKYGADRVNRRNWLKRSVEFILASWQFIPPVALLFMRKDGQRGGMIKELGMLTSSNALLTVWWTLYSKGVLALPWNKIKSFIMTLLSTS